MSAGRKSDSTVNRYSAFKKTQFSLAIDEKIIDRHPMKKIKKHPEPEGRLRYLKAWEIQNLIEAFPTNGRPPVILTLNTGLRREECLYLKCSDIDMDSQVLTVFKTKSGKRRKISLNEEAILVLSGLKSWMTSQWVFPSKNLATPIDPHNFYKRVFSPACKRVGLNDVIFHTLRHTIASRLAMKGVDIYSIQKLLEHSDIKVTQIYAHLSSDYLRSVVSILEGQY